MKPLLSTKSFGEILLVLADKAGVDLSEHRPWLAQAYRDAKDCREQQTQRESTNVASGNVVMRSTTKLMNSKRLRDEKLASPPAAPAAEDAGVAVGGRRAVRGETATIQDIYDQELADLEARINAKEQERDQLVQGMSEKGNVIRMTRLYWLPLVAKGS